MMIFNSLTLKLEEFKPLNPNKVTIYVCGITPYDTTHLGHGFTYIFFDTFIRFLKFTGYQVIYTQNVTDINDRDQDLLQKAKEENIPWNKLADYWTKRFLKDMADLNWIMPTNYLKASENMASMITLIQKLISNGLAYQVGPSVYLDTTKIPHFGKLSHLNHGQMIKTAKEFEEDLDNPDKRNPLDITLWRGSSTHQPAHIPSFDSPWGLGRPGWHIECSTMSMITLGERIDIHGGGIDLIFPHHESEIAQSEGVTGKIPFVKCWIHTGNIFYQGEKMSKSKGNLVMISDLLKKYSANTIRWLLLSHHYRDSWEYKEEDLKKARKNVTIVEQTIRHPALVPGSTQIFTQILDQDLDTPKALELLLKSPSKKIYEILGFII